VTIDYRWAAGRFDLLPAMAADVVRRPVALIVAFSAHCRVQPTRCAGRQGGNHDNSNRVS
jgi:hypothetical protein